MATVSNFNLFYFLSEAYMGDPSSIEQQYNANLNYLFFDNGRGVQNRANK
jgi:hypothetical protein